MSQAFRFQVGFGIDFLIKQISNPDFVFAKFLKSRFDIRAQKFSFYSFLVFVIKRVKSSQILRDKFYFLSFAAWANMRGLARLFFLGDEGVFVVRSMR